MMESVQYFNFSQEILFSSTKEFSFPIFPNIKFMAVLPSQVLKGFCVLCK